MRFEYWQTHEGSWHWHLRSSIGDILARGTPCETREMCLIAIKLVKLATSAGCHELPKRTGASASPWAMPESELRPA